MVPCNKVPCLPALKLYGPPATVMGTTRSRSSRVGDVAEGATSEQKEPPKALLSPKSWCPFHYPAPHLMGKSGINTKVVSREKIPSGLVVSEKELLQ